MSIEFLISIIKVFLVLGLLLTNTILLIWIERIAMEREALSIKWWAIALIPGQLINGFATIAASVVKTIEWRNVVYRVTKRPRGVAIMSSPTLSVAESTSTDSSSYG